MIYIATLPVHPHAPVVFKDALKLLSEPTILKMKIINASPSKKYPMMKRTTQIPLHLAPHPEFNGLIEHLDKHHPPLGPARRPIDHLIPQPLLDLVLTAHHHDQNHPTLDPLEPLDLARSSIFSAPFMILFPI
jgi:hypothetical protein